MPDFFVLIQKITHHRFEDKNKKSEEKKFLPLFLCEISPLKVTPPKGGPGH